MRSDRPIPPPARADARRRPRHLQVEPLGDRSLLSTIAALSETGNQLLRFDSDTPSVLLGSATITGLQGGAGETIVGIDVRPATGVLYGLSNEGGIGRLYTIN